jgi:hypothetical protein
MSQLSSKLRMAADSWCEDHGRTILHWCPGCKCLHPINIDRPNTFGAKWTWNGDVERPTFSPSIHLVGMCHYFIRDGMIEFCGDSKHALAGQTVPLPDLPAEERD